MCLVGNFETVITDKRITKDMKVEVGAKFRNIIYSLPNERKVSVKTELNFKIKLYRIGEIELVEDLKEIEDIQVKKRECNIQNVTMQKESIIASREDVMYEENITDFYEILKAVPYILSAEYKKSYNKLMIKGDMLIDVVYLNTSNIAKKIRLNLPFSGVIEVDELKDEAMVDILYSIMDFNISPNLIDGALKSFEVSYKVGAKVTIYEEQKRNIIEDFYSEQLDFNVQSNKCEAMLCAEEFAKYVDIREEILNVIMDGYKIIDYTILKENLIASVVNNNVLISGSVKVILLLQNEEKRAIESKTVEVKIDESIPLENKDREIEGNITIDKVNISEKNNNVEIKFRLNYKGKIMSLSNFECIESIESIEGEGSNIDSIYMYVVKKDDTLWNIAKKYKTTVDKIAKVNNIENRDLINIGQKLLIIR